MAVSFGLEPYQPIRRGQYQLVVRTFAPFREFIANYKGDNRDFSTANNVGFRTGMFLVFDVMRGVIVEGPIGKSSGSAGLCIENPLRQTVKRGIDAWRHVVDVHQSGVPTSPPEIYYDCRAWTTVDIQNRKTSEGFAGEVAFRASMSGNDPLVPFAPDINTHVRFGARLHDNTLCVKGSVRGDDYPNTEVFIRDANRQAVMLFKYKTAGGPAGVHRLGWENKNDVLGSFEMSFTLYTDTYFHAWKQRCTQAEDDDAKLARVSQAGYEDSVIPGDALFDFDSDELKPGADRWLKPWIKLLNSPARRFAIVGHTDSTGDANYNKGLSVRRAIAIQAWLLKNGVIGAMSCGIEGKGKSEPIATNGTAEGRRRNRRVEIKLLKN